MVQLSFVDEGQVEEVSQFLKVLADPNRLRIFATLIQGDSCNARLNEQLSLAPNLLSHHLRTLYEARLVRDCHWGCQSWLCP
jgi:ArsR family transcriptional regulator